MSRSPALLEATDPVSRSPDLCLSPDVPAPLPGLQGAGRGLSLGPREWPAPRSHGHDSALAPWTHPLEGAPHDANKARARGHSGKLTKHPWGPRTPCSPAVGPPVTQKLCLGERGGREGARVRAPRIFTGSLCFRKQEDFKIGILGRAAWPDPHPPGPIHSFIQPFMHAFIPSADVFALQDSLDASLGQVGPQECRGEGMGQGAVRTSLPLHSTSQHPLLSRLRCAVGLGSPGPGTLSSVSRVHSPAALPGQLSGAKGPRHPHTHTHIHTHATLSMEKTCPEPISNQETSFLHAFLRSFIHSFQKHFPSMVWCQAQAARDPRALRA